MVNPALLDAIVCSENNLKDVQSLLKEMHRVLKAGGVYLVVSHAPPDSRISHIKSAIDVDIDVIPIRKPEVKGVQESDDESYHYLYALTKSAH